MYKKIKRSLSLMLAVILIFTSTIPSFADTVPNMSAETIELGSEINNGDEGALSEQFEEPEPESEYSPGEDNQSEYGEESEENESGNIDGETEEDVNFEETEDAAHTSFEAESAASIVFEAGELIFYIGSEEEPDFMNDITAFTEDGENVTGRIEVENDGGFDINMAGVYDIQYVIRDGAEVMGSYWRMARVISPSATIYAEDKTIYASDFYVSDEICGDCGDVHGAPDEETAHMAAIMYGVYGWDADNRAIDNIIVTDDGGFTLNGQSGPGYIVKYAALDGNGDVIATASRTITVYQGRMSMYAYGYDLGNYDEENTLRVNVNPKGNASLLNLFYNGSWDDRAYCTEPSVKWFTGGQGWYGRLSNWGGRSLGDGQESSRTEGNTEYVDIVWSKAWGNNEGTTVQYLLGHKSVEMTMNVYTHLQAENDTNTSEKLEAFFSGQSNISQPEKNLLKIN